MLNGIGAFLIGLLKALMVPLLADRNATNRNRANSAEEVIDGVEKANANRDNFLASKLYSSKKQTERRQETESRQLLRNNTDA